MWFMVQNLYLEEYTPNWLAKFVHSWPHISYKTFTSYNSSFAPNNDKYVEVSALSHFRNLVFDEHHNGLLLLIVIGLAYTNLHCYKLTGSPRPTPISPKTWAYRHWHCNANGPTVRNLDIVYYHTTKISGFYPTVHYSTEISVATRLELGHVRPNLGIGEAYFKVKISCRVAFCNSVSPV